MRMTLGQAPSGFRYLYEAMPGVVARCGVGRASLIAQKVTFLHGNCATCLKNGHFL